MYAFLRDYVPGFENCYISYVPSCIGIRETRRLHGAYVLTKEDLHTGKKFADTIGRRLQHDRYSSGLRP